MAVLVILFIASLVALAVLLGCLRGFSRALRHKKVLGLFVSLEEPRVRRPQGPSKTLVAFPQRTSQPVKDPDRRHVSGGTLAMMSLIVALGSRGVSNNVRDTSAPEPLSRSLHEDRTQVPEIQPGAAHDNPIGIGV